MNTMQSTWPGAVAVVVLIGGVLLTNYGSGLRSIDAQATSVVQLTELVNKLDQFIAPVGESSPTPFHPGVDADEQSLSRFVVSFPGAVLDKQTGLVWEQTPDATPRTWSGAVRYCIDKAVGGTIGWRVPSMAELKSLFDVSMAPPFVPTSVFPHVQATIYWSASNDPIGVSIVHFVDDRASDGNTSQTFPAWCVRGGVNAKQF
jgi:hypothetical protein